MAALRYRTQYGGCGMAVHYVGPDGHIFYVNSIPLLVCGLRMTVLASPVRILLAATCVIVGLIGSGSGGGMRDSHEDATAILRGIETAMADIRSLNVIRTHED